MTRIFPYFPFHRRRIGHDRQRRSNRAAGFTLFETLAATMILAIALVVVLQLFSGGLRSGHLSESYGRAVMHAREKMETLLLAQQLREQTTSGAWEDGFTWRTEIKRYNADTLSVMAVDERQPPAAAIGQLTPFLVTVSVQWEDGSRHRQTAIQTLALARWTPSEEQ